MNWWQKIKIPAAVWCSISSTSALRHLRSIHPNKSARQGVANKVFLGIDRTTCVCTLSSSRTFKVIAEKLPQPYISLPDFMLPETRDSQLDFSNWKLVSPDLPTDDNTPHQHKKRYSRLYRQIPKSINSSTRKHTHNYCGRVTIHHLVHLLQHQLPQATWSKK